MAYVTGNRFANTVTQATISITPSGNNRAVIAFINIGGGASITGVTCGGNNMTLHDTQAGGYFGTTMFIYKISGVTASTQDVVIDVSALTEVSALVFAVDEADQTTILRTAAKTNGSAASSTLNATSQNGDTVLDGIWVLNATALTPGANQTERTTEGVDSNNARFVGSDETATGTSTAMSWTWTGTLSYTHMAAAVIPASGGGGGGSGVINSVTFRANTNQYRMRPGQPGSNSYRFRTN